MSFPLFLTAFDLILSGNNHVELFIWPGSSEPGGAGGAGAPNNCQTVVCFLYNSVLNEKEKNGATPPPPKYEFRSDGTVAMACSHYTECIAKRAKMAYKKICQIV